MTKEHLIVFDIDGTLTSSEHQHTSAFIKVTQEIGIPKINTDWNSYAQVTDSYILKTSFEHHFQKPFDPAICSSFENRMHELIIDKGVVNAIEGAVEMLNHLWYDTKYAIAFATGSFELPALLKLNQAKLPYDTQLLTTANSWYKREEIIQDSIQKAHQYFDVDTFKDIYYAGDGLWDLKAAKNLELKFIGIGNKFNVHSFKPLIQIDNWLEFEPELLSQF